MQRLGSGGLASALSFPRAPWAARPIAVAETGPAFWELPEWEKAQPMVLECREVPAEKPS